MAETILKSRDTCYACAVQCKRVVSIEGRVVPDYGGPEYETIATLGSLCEVRDLAARERGKPDLQRPGHGYDQRRSDGSLGDGVLREGAAYSL